MTVVGLHPEELFDKLLDGEITPQERERLRAHLESCDVCRFEHAARADFWAEALELAISSPPPALPLRPFTSSEPDAEAAVVVRPVQRRRRSRLMIWGLAAAALITASGAVASGYVGKAPWHGAWLLFSPSAKPSEQLAPVAAKKTRGVPAAAVAEASTQAPEAAQPSVVEAPSAEAPSVEAVAVAPEAAALPHVHVSSQPRASSVKAPTVLAAVAPSSADMPSAKDAAVKDATVKEPSNAAKLFGEANQARRSGDVGRASGLYHLLQDQFPSSPEAELSRVTLAMLLLDSGDARGALGGFERYLAGSSRALEAEALVGRARALGRLGRRDLEVSAWQEVQRKYLHSIYGRQATERLLALGQP